MEKTPVKQLVDEWLSLDKRQNLRDALHEWLALAKVSELAERAKPEPEFTKNQFEEALKKVSRRKPVEESS